ncbi:unnamed protein product [Lota lota]
MKLNPQQAPLYGECVLTVCLEEDEACGPVDDAKSGDGGGEKVFYLLFSGSTQRHLTTTLQISNVTLQAVCPAHDACEQVVVTLCVARPDGQVDPQSQQHFCYVQDLALHMAHFLLNNGAPQGVMLLDDQQVPLKECERLDQSLALALRHLTLPRPRAEPGTQKEFGTDAWGGHRWSALLHFAASRGLRRVALFLLRQPAARKALRQRDAQGDTPASLAQRKGHQQLAELLTRSEESEGWLHVYPEGRVLQCHPVLGTYTLTLPTHRGKEKEREEGARAEGQRSESRVLKDEVEELRRLVQIHREQKEPEQPAVEPAEKCCKATEIQASERGFTVAGTASCNTGSPCPIQEEKATGSASSAVGRHPTRSRRNKKRTSRNTGNDISVTRTPEKAKNNPPEITGSKSELITILPKELIREGKSRSSSEPTRTPFPIVPLSGTVCETGQVVVTTSLAEKQEGGNSELCLETSARETKREDLTAKQTNQNHLTSTKAKCNQPSEGNTERKGRRLSVASMGQGQSLDSETNPGEPTRTDSGDQSPRIGPRGSPKSPGAVPRRMLWQDGGWTGAVGWSSEQGPELAASTVWYQDKSPERLPTEGAALLSQGKDVHAQTAGYGENMAENQTRTSLQSDNGRLEVSEQKESTLSQPQASVVCSVGDSLEPYPCFQVCVSALSQVRDSGAQPVPSHVPGAQRQEASGKQRDQGGRGEGEAERKERGADGGAHGGAGGDDRRRANSEESFEREEAERGQEEGAEETADKGRKKRRRKRARRGAAEAKLSSGSSTESHVLMDTLAEAETQSQSNSPTAETQTEIRVPPDWAGDLQALGSGAADKGYPPSTERLVATQTQPVAQAVAGRAGSQSPCPSESVLREEVDTGTMRLPSQTEDKSMDCSIPIVAHTDTDSHSPTPSLAPIDKTSTCMEAIQHEGAPTVEPPQQEEEGVAEEGIADVSPLKTQEGTADGTVTADLGHCFGHVMPPRDGPSEDKLSEEKGSEARGGHEEMREADIKERHSDEVVVAASIKSCMWSREESEVEDMIESNIEVHDNGENENRREAENRSKDGEDNLRYNEELAATAVAVVTVAVASALANIELSQQLTEGKLSKESSLKEQTPIQSSLVVSSEHKLPLDTTAQVSVSENQLTNDLQAELATTPPTSKSHACHEQSDTDDNCLSEDKVSADEEYQLKKAEEPQDMEHILQSKQSVPEAHVDLEQSPEANIKNTEQVISETISIQNCSLDLGQDLTIKAASPAHADTKSSRDLNEVLAAQPASPTSAQSEGQLCQDDQVPCPVVDTGQGNGKQLDVFDSNAIESPGLKECTDDSPGQFNCSLSEELLGISRNPEHSARVPLVALFSFLENESCEAGESQGTSKAGAAIEPASEACLTGQEGTVVFVCEEGESEIHKDGSAEGQRLPLESEVCSSGVPLSKSQSKNSYMGAVAHDDEVSKCSLPACEVILPVNPDHSLSGTCSGNGRTGGEGPDATGGDEEEKKDQLPDNPVASSTLRASNRSLSPFRRHSWESGRANVPGPPGDPAPAQRRSVHRVEVRRAKPPLHRRSFSLEGLEVGRAVGQVNCPRTGAYDRDDRSGTKGSWLDNQERGGGSLVSLTEEEQEGDANSPVSQSAHRELSMQTSCPTSSHHQPLTKSISMVAISQRETDGVGSFSTTSGSLEYSISEEEPGPLRSNSERGVVGGGVGGTKVSRTFSYLRSKMSKKNKGSDKEKKGEKERESKEREKKQMNGHAFSPALPPPSSACPQCARLLLAKDSFLCTNCGVHVHKNCRESLSICAKGKMKSEDGLCVFFLVSPYPAASSASSLSTPSSFSLPRGERWSTLASSEDQGPQSFLRKNSNMHSNLSKSISTSNIAGLDEVSLKGLKFLSRSTDNLHQGSKVNASTESLTDEGTEMMDSQLMGEFECDVKELEADSWSATVDKKFLKLHKKDEVKRQDVIYELFQTELHHVRTLRIMSEVYYKGLQMELQLDTQTLEKVFPMLDDLLETHTHFLTLLLERKRTSQVEGRGPSSFLIHSIGDILMNQFSGCNADRMKKVYGKFCSRHNEAVNLYKELHAKDKRFQALIKRLMSSSIVRRLSIPECVLLVTQRITKYPVLIQRILQHTKGKYTDEDHTCVSEALRCVKELIAAVDSKVNEQEKKTRLREVYSRTDSKSIMRMKSGQMFAKEDLIRGRRLLHDGALQLKNTAGRLKDVHAMLLSDVLVFMQEKDQKYVFASLDQRSTVISIQKLIVREVANEERGLFLITAGTDKPEMVNVLASSKDERNTWMSIIQDAMHCIEKEEDEGVPSETEEDRRQQENRAKEIRELLRRKDQQIVSLLEEKVHIFKDLCDCNPALDEGSPPIRERMLFRATPDEVTKGEPIIKDALKEVESLHTLVNSSVGGAGGSTTISLTGGNVGPVCLPRRAETFGGFDSHQMNSSKSGEKEEGDDALDLRRTESDSVLKKGVNTSLQMLLKKNNEQVQHSVGNLHNLLTSLQAVVVQQDSFIEDQRLALSERLAAQPSSRNSSSSSLSQASGSSSSSRPSSLIEQEKQRSLERQRQEAASLQKQQAAHQEERRRREREWETREQVLGEREVRLQAEEEAAAQAHVALEEEREELQRRKEEYQRDLERLREAQRRLEREREALRRETERLEALRSEERTSSSTSEESLRFHSSSSLDQESREAPEAAKEVELSSSAPTKEPFLRIGSKRMGKNFNPFSSSSSSSSSTSSSSKTQGGDKDSQLPNRLLQLAKTKSKKEKKKKGKEGEREETGQAMVMSEPHNDGKVIFC